MLEQFLFWLLDMPVLYPMGAASVFAAITIGLAIIVMWPLPPHDKE